MLPRQSERLGTINLDHSRIFLRDSCQCFQYSTRKKLGCQMNWGWNMFLNISSGSEAHKCNRWSSDSFEVYRKTTLDFDEVWISSFSHHLLVSPSLHSHHKIKTEIHVYFWYSCLDFCFELCTGVQAPFVCTKASYTYSIAVTVHEKILYNLQASAYENLIPEALWFQTLLRRIREVRDMSVC